ncbi:jg19629 [Pararge aegeria aegeria]|uniref:Jg19629 protein n=1 Tax=Pararge aegeria aegeria TaxID=348720 RepID=A0A8S4SH20_9NEOP|nr:jg19629 [Pararge aegeria aegeria]
MEDLSVIINGSVLYYEEFAVDVDLVNSPYNNMTSPLESAFKSRAAEFGIISGILIAFLINLVMSFEYETMKRKVKIKIESENLLQKSLILLILLLSLPLVVAFLIGASLYKFLCSIIIKRRDKHFAGFLDSFDVFWSLEDDATKSIINVLGIIESQSSQELIEHIKEKLQSIVQNNDTEKLFYRRSEEYGFYYWRKCCYIDSSQYVRVIDVSNVINLSVSDLEEIMTEVSYQPLPFNDEGLFQILVTNQKIKNNDKGNSEYGIIFRIHHAVGDGVALIEFLCQTLADGKDDELITFCMPETYNVSSKKTGADYLNMITKLCEIPGCLIDGILREPDKSSLHGPPLTGKKFYKWVESNDNLFQMVKDIKENVEEANFSDILATALSSGFRDYFRKEIHPAPNNIAVILPIRFPAVKNGRVKLENNFTVSILDLPLGGDLKEIRRRFNRLRNSSDPLTNYYILKLCSVFPKEILTPMFNSNQATMVFSNLPGPKVLRICGGDLKSLVFFVPNKGNTGLGITALCYDGVLRLGAMADSALVSSPDELGIILDGMVKEIRSLHDKYVN